MYTEIFLDITGRAIDRDQEFKRKKWTLTFCSKTIYWSGETDCNYFAVWVVRKTHEKHLYKYTFLNNYYRYCRTS